MGSDIGTKQKACSVTHGEVALIKEARQMLAEIFLLRTEAILRTKESSVTNSPFVPIPLPATSTREQSGPLSPIKYFRFSPLDTKLETSSVGRRLELLERVRCAISFACPVRNKARYGCLASPRVHQTDSKKCYANYDRDPHPELTK